jgi:metal-responsive CopG/Arc/MetJ family transcriptional regulator
MATTKVSVSLPVEVLQQAEERLARPHESRSALMARVLADALQKLDEAEAEERYARSYSEKPETEDERRVNGALARSLFARQSDS